MKVLLTTVSLSADRGGGTAERTRRLALNLQRAGHDCTVVTIEGGALADQLAQAGVKVEVTGFTRVRFTFPHLNLRKLVRLVGEADVIHVLGYWNMLSVATSFLAHRLGRPFALSAAGEFVGLVQPRPKSRAFHRLFGTRMIRNATSLIAITALERRQILERFNLPPDKVVVIPNGVDEPPTFGGDLPGFPPAPFILFVGRLAAVKGPDLLLAAFRGLAGSHAGLSLVIAGPDFGLGDELRLASEPPLSGQVSFPGFLNEAQRTAAYRQALFLVVPSRAEAMSLVALEAGIAGCPVLLTDQCGFDEVEAVGGGLVVPATSDALRDGIERMLACSPELKQMGQALRDYVVRHYSWPHIIAELVKHFSELTGQAAKASAYPQRELR